MGQNLSTVLQDDIQTPSKSSNTAKIIFVMVLFGFDFIIAFSGLDTSSTSGIIQFFVLFFLVILITVIYVANKKRHTPRARTPAEREALLQQQRIEQLNDDIKFQQNKAKYEEEWDRKFGNNSMTKSSDQQAGYTREESGIFGRDPLQDNSGDLMSKVCGKCYSALDADGNCPHCSFK